MEVLLSLALSLVAIFLVVVLHAYLVICEVSLVKFRYGWADDAVLAELKRRRGIARLMEHGAQAGRTIRFGKTLCTVGIGVFLLTAIGDFFELIDGVLTPSLWLVVALSLVGAVLVHFFFAEVFPRGLAMRNPVRMIQRAYRVLLVFQLLSFPVMFFFQGVKEVFYRRLGVDIADELNPLDLDVQIRAMGEDSSELSPVVRKIVNRTLQMQELVVQDILLPRSQVVICDLDEDFSENLEAMREAGHTRFPLCCGNLDECVGILHIKDIFRESASAHAADPLKLKRPVAEFPLETPIEEALERMLRAKFHMALAVDEFGGVVGLVTLESILEELVGEIQDEFDCEEAQIVALGAPNTYRISGLTPIHDLEEALGIEIDNDEVSTFGGLITGALGRIPARGQSLSIFGLAITVDEVDERRVIAAHVVRRP